MIGLIFGDTDFPKEILKTIKKRKINYLIIDLSKSKKYKKNKKSHSVSLGQFGRIIDILKENNCKSVLFAGKVNKPNFTKLKLDIKKSIYLTFVNEDGSQERLKLKVVGIFKSGNSIFDGSHMFAQKDYLDKIFGKEDIIHEIALVSNNINQAKELKYELLKAFPDNEIELWSEISPELGYANEMLSFFLYIFMTIILIALSFGIINTMLMAILERKRELGVLMSVGLNKSKIFLMIALETLFISIVSVPLGVFLSYVTISYFGDVGIDLSMVEEGLEQFGMGTRLYTELYLDYYINITLLTFLLTFISSLFPARRALKLEPAVAVRSI